MLDKGSNIRNLVRQVVEELLILEDIKLPIKVGDVILGGKFKNKKITVKEIGKNEKGDITINGKPLLRFRIIKQETKGTTQAVIVAKQLQKPSSYRYQEGFTFLCIYNDKYIA